MLLTEFSCLKDTGWRTSPYFLFFFYTYFPPCRRVSDTTDLSSLKMAPVKYLLVSAGLLASVMADYVAFSEWPASLVAGQPVTLKWVGGSDAVSLPSILHISCRQHRPNTKDSPQQSPSAKAPLQTCKTCKSSAVPPQTANSTGLLQPICRMPTTTLFRFRRAMRSITRVCCRCLVGRMRRMRMR